MKSQDNKSKEINDILVNFIKVMEENFPEEYLENMYNNLLTLKILPKKDNFIDNFISLYVLGRYYYNKNKIKLYTENVDCVLNHELLHMSSFSKGNKLRFKGLDEAYTQFLANYYFHENTLSYHILFVECLDKIMGHNVLSKLYLSGNLIGVVNFLKKIASEEEIYCFIKNMNNLYNKSYYDFEKIQKYIDEVYDFIVTLYARRQYKKFNNNEINNEECYYTIIFYADQLRKNIKSLFESNKKYLENDGCDLGLRLELK